MLYRAHAEFLVGSRIPWTDRESELRDHLDQVVALLKEQAAIGEIVADGDPVRSWVKLEVVFHAPKERQDPGHDVRVMLSEAISGAGAMFDGLLSLGEEARAKPNRNAWWGLRTPRWSARAFRLETVEET